MSDPADIKTATQCRRCGTCCHKGGPALHIEDQPLVASGKIPLRNLFTIRQGEMAYDNVAGAIAPAVTDIIKIKSCTERRGVCLLYRADQSGCGLYAHRPAECRALKCWDTLELERIYNCRRLTRRHLLSQVEGLWELVTDHQELCDPTRVAELAAQIKQPHQEDDAAQRELMELVRYDQSIRELTKERSGLDPEMLEFLFGRPLSFTIGTFQLKLSRTESGAVIEPTGKTAVNLCYRRHGLPKP